MSFLMDLGPWAWIAAGVVLVALEVAAPGAFMLWLGVAALLTGLVLFLVPLGWEFAALLFALLATASVLVSRYATRNRMAPSPEPMLNRRGDALVGRVVVLEDPIVQGRGRVRIDDTVWRVEGADAPAGDRVRITGVDGALLRVEKAAA
jgi:membrane protein implicated in regulation of membrane protease activity